MIPADHIAFTDDGHAWWVPVDFASALTYGQLDQPCSYCDGRQLVHWDGFGDVSCDEDCIDGRHTFEIEVEQYACGRECTPVVCGTTMRTQRVSIVPGMVLPIVAWGEQGDYEGQRCLVTQLPRPTAVLMDDEGRQGETATLPSAAEPDMWAVKLRVAL